MDMSKVKSISIDGKKVVGVAVNGVSVWNGRTIGTYELRLYPARHQEKVNNSDGTYGIAFAVHGVGDWYIDGQHIGAINHSELASVYYDEVEEREYRVTFVGKFEQISTLAKSTTAVADPASDLREILQWDNSRSSTYEKQFFYAGRNIEKFLIPSFITTISARTFYYGKFVSLRIPSQVNVIDSEAFAYSRDLKTIYFEQPQGMEVSLPLPIVDSSGMLSTGMCYCKDAKEMTIYTDNETIKNYDWAADNVTATIYRLDGTKWEA